MQHTPANLHAKKHVDTACLSFPWATRPALPGGEKAWQRGSTVPLAGVSCEEQACRPGGRGSFLPHGSAWRSDRKRPSHCSVILARLRLRRRIPSCSSFCFSQRHHPVSANIRISKLGLSTPYVERGTRRHVSGTAAGSGAVCSILSSCQSRGHMISHHRAVRRSASTENTSVRAASLCCILDKLSPKGPFPPAIALP